MFYPKKKPKNFRRGINKLRKFLTYQAPSSFIDPETRRKMGEQAVSLCKEVGYKSAGILYLLVV